MIGLRAWARPRIARRLARLADAPFIKVEATKFTEVGYVGRDVDTIVRDLRRNLDQGHSEAATKKCDAERRIRRGAGARRPATSGTPDGPLSGRTVRATGERSRGGRVRDAAEVSQKLREGELDDREVEIEVSAQQRTWRYSPRPGWRS